METQHKIVQFMSYWRKYHSKACCFKALRFAWTLFFFGFSICRHASPHMSAYTVNLPATLEYCRARKKRENMTVTQLSQSIHFCLDLYCKIRHIYSVTCIIY